MSMSDNIVRPFDLFVGWKDGELWIGEDNGSGCWYDCPTIDNASRLVAEYIENIQEREA